MKHILTLILLLFSLTAAAQGSGFTRTKKTTTKTVTKSDTKKDSGVKKDSGTKNDQKKKYRKRKQQAQAEPETVEEVVAVQPSKPKVTTPRRTPQELRTESFSVKGVAFSMCYVVGGTFKMGATAEQGSDVGDDEKPAHKVTVSNFYIGQTEVTQALWKAVMGKKPSKFKGENLPVEQVTWNDCQTFIEKLNFMTGRTFRLPTEAEWEFAARGGNNSKDYKYSGSHYQDDVAWHSDNGNGKTHMVGTKLANELGIYDMSGNVSEWCSDWYGSDYYDGSGDSKDPRGVTSGTSRVVRGGSWGGSIEGCRVAYRYNSMPDTKNNALGLRLALSE